MSLDELLRAVLEAPDDASRGVASQRLTELPDALTQIAQRLSSREWPQRAMSLHFVTRLVPPPALFASGVIHCLRSPLDHDPLGDETALVLVCCKALAPEVQGFRDVLAARVRAIDSADGPRAPVMRRLAHEALDAVDEAVLASKRAWKAEVGLSVELIRAGKRDEAMRLIEEQSAGGYYPELGRAGRWESAADAFAGDRDAEQFCLQHAYDEYAHHASGASSGGEGMARMLDVNRIGKRLDRPPR